MLITCPECKGKGYISCPDCRGQGRQPSSTAMQRLCMSCHGRGTALCPRCLGGKKIEEKK